MKDTYSIFLIYHNEFRAAQHSLRSALIHYPDAPIILAQDSFEDLHLSEIQILGIQPKHLSKMSCMTRLMKPRVEKIDNFKFTMDESIQIINCHINRLSELVETVQTENIIFMEPDSILRGRILRNPTYSMEFVTPNKYNSNFLLSLEKLSNSKVEFDGWGFNVGVVTRECLMGIVEWVKTNPDRVIEILELDDRLVYNDFCLPIFAHCAGFKVGRSNQITEVKRDFFWRWNRKPMVHQFKKYYEEIY